VLALEMGVVPSALLDEPPDLLDTLTEVHNFKAKESERRNR